MVSCGSNNSLYQLLNWFHIEVPCSTSCLIHPYTLTTHILCLIILAVNYSQGIVAILHQFSNYSVDFLEFRFLFLVSVQ